MPKSFIKNGIVYITLRLYRRQGIPCVHGISADGEREIKARLVDVLPAITLQAA